MKKKRTYTVIDGFKQISFESKKAAYKYCRENNLSQTNVFLDER